METLILDSMERTLVVLAYMDWCDAWDSNDPRPTGKRPTGAVSARGGEDWMDAAPVGSRAFRRRCTDRAAILYGQIAQAWGGKPYAALYQHDDKDARDWGHYAVMSAVGHGVAWGDDHDALEWKGVEVKVRGVHIETPSWPGRYPA